MFFSTPRINEAYAFEQREKVFRTLNVLFMFRNVLILSHLSLVLRQNVPEMSDEVVNSISHRYIELFEKVTGEKFKKRSYAGVDATIEANVLKSCPSA